MDKQEHPKMKWEFILEELDSMWEAVDMDDKGRAILNEHIKMKFAILPDEDGGPTKAPDVDASDPRIHWRDYFLAHVKKTSERNFS